jgi:L-rhamnose mutarotase
MLEALRRTGWHNYSLFLRDDGLLIGNVETPEVVAKYRRLVNWPAAVASLDWFVFATAWGARGTRA